MTVRPFEDLLAPVLRAEAPRPLPPGECQSASGQRCILCAASAVTYDRETTAKQAALRRFWTEIGTPAPLEPLIRSPLGRGYRTVTKRKVFHSGDRVRIGLIDPTGRGNGRFDPLVCAIEPREHADIYAAVRQELAQRRTGPLADELSYVIVKGSYSERTVLLNVRSILPGIVQAANALSRRISKTCRGIRGVFLYEGGVDDGYYQGTRGSQRLRKIYGAAGTKLTVAGTSFSYGPLSFSQINHSILELLVTTAGTLLQPSPDATLFDLYCGFGFFALSLGTRYRRAVGVERSATAVDEARRNAAHQRVGTTSFLRNDITPEALGKILGDLRPTDHVLLDPPRGGTASGVIETIAARRPARVLHIFCAIDLVPPDLRRWEAGGYRLSRAVPMDLFPGTPDIEMLLLFERSGDRAG